MLLSFYVICQNLVSDRSFHLCTTTWIRIISAVNMGQTGKQPSENLNLFFDIIHFPLLMYL